MVRKIITNVISEVSPGVPLSMAPGDNTPEARPIYIGAKGALIHTVMVSIPDLDKDEKMTFGIFTRGQITDGDFTMMASLKEMESQDGLNNKFMFVINNMDLDYIDEEEHASTYTGNPDDENGRWLWLYFWNPAGNTHTVTEITVRIAYTEQSNQR